MLELLKLRIDGFGVGESSINIWTQNGHLRYSYDRSPLDTDPGIIVKVPESIADNFLDKLQEIHVYRWKDHYERTAADNRKQSPLMDAHWSLIYKELGCETLAFTGDGAYPKNWDKFIDLVTGLVNESHAVHLNGLSHLDIVFHETRTLKGYDYVNQCHVKKAIPYSETLTIDRREGVLRYTQVPNDHTSVKHEYNVPEIIDHLLGNCERYFHDFENKSYNHIDPGKPVISVRLIYQNGKTAGFKRTYDRFGVPDDWRELLVDLHETMSFFGLYGPIFDERLYRHGLKKGELIYLSVSDTEGKSYYYRTLDEDLNIGDLVIIPAKNVTKKKIAIISEIVYCTKENVPKPLEETGFIIGKYYESDSDSCFDGHDPEDYDFYDDFDDDDF
ncbi:hypothetical protein [Oribacterium sp. WCC10]|uniref:hypothetical protein n=1 Tax=Oribacterium sp. WCC10 TaxID=1855343 RepID=UPI0008E5C324|nr:hypothetical protein [Oribacterium sp. WCC10]SFG09974.1 hypothetical protein SAMN05216356_101246 [Oribacterium sp. WCC10]